jgi:hypothetical protein
VWFRLAAAQEHPRAQSFLSLCYAYGEGVAQNEEKAVEWYLKAAEQGEESAIKALELTMSNPVFADWAGMDDNGESNVPILRKFNYRLETGEVGTDDENIANVLYNINKSEMYKSFSTSDLKELDATLGKLFFLVLNSKVHLNRFNTVFSEKINTKTFDDVTKTLDNAMDTIRAKRSEIEGNPDINEVCKAFSSVYCELLQIVTKILELDAQAVGRV